MLMFVRLSVVSSFVQSSQSLSFGLSQSVFCLVYFVNESEPTILRLVFFYEFQIQRSICIELTSKREQSPLLFSLSQNCRGPVLKLYEWDFNFNSWKQTLYVNTATRSSAKSLLKLNLEVYPQPHFMQMSNRVLSIKVSIKNIHITRLAVNRVKP